MIFTWIREALRRRGEEGWIQGEYDGHHDTHCLVGWIRKAAEATGAGCSDVLDAQVDAAQALYAVLSEDCGLVEIEGAVGDEICVENLNDWDETGFKHIMQTVDRLAEDELAGAEGTEQLAPAGPVSHSAIDAADVSAGNLHGGKPGDSSAPVEVEPELVEV